MLVLAGFLAAWVLVLVVFGAIAWRVNVRATAREAALARPLTAHDRARFARDDLLQRGE